MFFWLFPFPAAMSLYWCPRKALFVFLFPSSSGFLPHKDGIRALDLGRYSCPLLTASLPSQRTPHCVILSILSGRFSEKAVVHRGRISKRLWDCHSFSSLLESHPVSSTWLPCSSRSPTLLSELFLPVFRCILLLYMSKCFNFISPGRSLSLFNLRLVASLWP